MPISEARRQGLLNLIAKNPEKREYILSRAGATEADIGSDTGFVDRFLGSFTNPEILRPAADAFEKTAIGQELGAYGEGAVSGVTQNIANVPKKSDPVTVDLPFFGKVSPSRVAGNISGAMANPVAFGSGAVGKLITNRIAPKLVTTVAGRAIAGAAGADVTGMGIETVRELATEEKIDPLKIMKVGAMDLAASLVPDMASGAYSQFKAWLSKVPEPIRNLVERFKSLPEVVKRAEEIANRLKQEYANIGKPPQPEPEFGGLIPQTSKTLQDARMRESPDVIEAARTRAELQSPSRQIANTSSAPVAPQLPVPHNQADYLKSQRELQGYEQAAAQKTKQLTHEKAMADKQKFDREIELEYYKKDMEFIKKIEDASRKGEAIPIVVYDEYKKALGRMNRGTGPFESTPSPSPVEQIFPTSYQPPVSIQKTGSFDPSGRSQRLGGLPGTGPGFPTEDLNMSAVGGKKVVKPKPKSTTKKK